MPAAASTLTDPASAVAHLEETTPELRGCAILDSQVQVLASSGEGADWGKAATELIGAASAASRERPDHVHIATGDGEVFCVKWGELTALAVAERFVLSSLLLFDLRAALRELAGAR